MHARVQEDLEFDAEAPVNGLDGVRDGLVGGVVGGVVSGAPSTVHALATRGGVLTAARAAGALLGKPGLGRGLVAHAGISMGWGAVLGVALPRRHPVAAGAVAGLAIAALDPELVGDVLNVMRDLAAEGMTMLVVTHEMGFARRVADHVAFIDEGIICEEGPPDQVLVDPQLPRTRQFLQQVLEH